jgi:ABC-type polysaccharide/polyol phosphate transport system ATPase subunit
MLSHPDTIIEVNKISKLYSRREAATRGRFARLAGRSLLGLKPKEVSELNQGEFWALNDISFSLKRGEAVGIIGFNGAGKTTLLRILSSQILPDSGEINILGNSASMIDLTAGFTASASGRLNIYYRGAALGRTQQEIESTIDEVIEFSELGDAIDAPFSTYSSGMKMRLAFSIMIVSEPDILFIDEVLAVGDFQFRQKSLAKIREIRERVAFVLVSHSMNTVKLFCNKAILLNKGEIAFQGDPEEAIEIYEKMLIPSKVSKNQRHNKTLNPQFHNDKTISDVEHFWCDEFGNPIDEIQSGQDLHFHVSFKLNYRPRNLIIGVPVWTDAGVYITGFSTPRATKGLVAMPNKKTQFRLKVPSQAFNPDEYISNLAVNDGPEFLYRGANPVLKVTGTGREYWGHVTLPHVWESVPISKADSDGVNEPHNYSQKSEAYSADPRFVFNGKNSIEAGTSSFDAPYEIKVILRSQSESVKLKRTDISTPMPFLAGAFSVFQLGVTYGFATNGKIVAEGGVAQKKQEINLSVDKAGVGRIIVEGEVLWSGEVGGEKPLKIGMGIRSRYWRGTVFKFEVQEYSELGRSKKAPRKPAKFDLFADYIEEGK